jgi:hypothetical protein
MTRIDLLRRALRDIASGNIPRAEIAREPGEPLERHRERLKIALLAWLQERARQALIEDDKLNN